MQPTQSILVHNDPTCGDVSLSRKHSHGKSADPVEQPPEKRQRQDDEFVPFDLDQLSLIASAPTGATALTVLNIFAPLAFTNGELRNAHHYDYDGFREWLYQKVGIPKDKAIAAIVQDRDGVACARTILDEWDFAGLLGHIRHGIVAAPRCPDFGYNIAFELDEEDRNSGDPLQLPGAAEEGNDSISPEQNSDGAPSDLGDDEGPPEIGRRPPSATIDVLKGGRPPVVADPIRDEDESSASPAESSEDSSSSLTHFDEATLQRALRFFQVTENGSGQYHIKGIARPVHMYQLYAAYGLFMGPLTYGVNGALVGWDVGLGKTMLMLLYIRARATLAVLWKDIQAQWAEADVALNTAPFQHLPRTGSPSNSRCPIQTRLMVECPCVATSDARRLCQAYLTDTPVLIVVPPSLAHSWLAEAQAVYDDEQATAKGQQLLTFYTSVSKLRHPTNPAASRGYARWDTVVGKTVGRAVALEFVDDKNELYLETLITRGEGGARDVFLVSSKSVEKLYRRYPTAEGMKQACRCFTVGLVVMDEHQQYKGVSKTEATIPFRVLETISETASHPITLFTLCGTTLEEGPSAWRAPIRHFEAQWEWYGDSSLQCRDGASYGTTDASYRAARQAYLGLVRRLASQDKDKEKVTRNGMPPPPCPEVRALVDFFQPAMWSLRQGQRYRGRPINPLPPCEERFEYLDPVMDMPTHRAFSQLIGGVQAPVQRKLERMVAVWETADPTERGPKPTRESLVEALVSGEHKTEAAFLCLQRASMYPYLAILLDTLERAVFDSSSCQISPQRCQHSLLNGASLEDVLRELRTWDFNADLDQIQRSSAKYQHIRKLIREMITAQDTATMPLDGSGKRHAIVYHSQPVSAMLTYVLLLHDPTLRGIVTPLLLCSQSDDEDRDRIVKLMNEDCTAQSSSKILITLTSIGAEGFNLQRVNNVWFAELPGSLSKKEQAKGRVYRQGQTMKVHVVKLLERGNLMEELGYDAMSAKETVARLLYGVEA